MDGGTIRNVPAPAGPSVSPDGQHAVSPEGDPLVVALPSGGYLVRSADGWAPPVTGEHLAYELHRRWPDVQVTTEVEGKAKVIAPAGLRARYGRHCWHVAYTYGEAGYDYASETVIVPAARGSFPLPARSVVAAVFLAEYAGDRVGALLDWLACAWRVREPIAALLLTGPKYSGKSTLCKAIAHPWGAWADLEGALGDFQDGLLRTPILVADEGLAVRDGARTRRFRALVTAGAAEVNPKGRARGRLDGAPRVVVAANGIDGLRVGSEDLTDDDAEAIGSRILHVPAGESAARYLAEHPELTTEVLCAHIAHLAATRDVPSGGRLLVPGSGVASVSAAVASTDRAHEIYSAILDEIEAPRTGSIGAGARAVVASGGDTLTVHVGALLAARPWARRPSPRGVSRALAAVGGTYVDRPRPRRWLVSEAALRAAVGEG